MFASFGLPQDYQMPFLGYLFFANCLALAVFGWNRASSEDGDWGSAEMRVVLLSILGGWIGAKLGRMMYPADEEPRSFGAILNLSVLAVPMILATPYLLHKSPEWISTGYLAYVAQYAEDQKAANAAKVSPLGAASQSLAADSAAPDASGVVAAAEDSPATAIVDATSKVGDAVASAAQSDVAAPVMPRRFGPGTTKKTMKGGIQFLSVGGN